MVDERASPQTEKDHCSLDVSTVFGERTSTVDDSVETCGFSESDGTLQSSEGVLWITTGDGGVSHSVTEGAGALGTPLSYTIHLDAPVDHDVWACYGISDMRAAAETVDLEGARVGYGGGDRWARIPARETAGTVDVRIGPREGDGADGGGRFSVELKGASKEEGGEPWGMVLEGCSAVTTTIVDDDPASAGEEAVDDRSWERTGVEPPEVEAVLEESGDEEGTGIQEVPKADRSVVDRGDPLAVVDRDNPLAVVDRDAPLTVDVRGEGGGVPIRHDSDGPSPGQGEGDTMDSAGGSDAQSEGGAGHDTSGVPRGEDIVSQAVEDHVLGDGQILFLA